MVDGINVTSVRKQWGKKKKNQIKLFYVIYVLYNSASRRAGEYNGIKGFSLQKDLVPPFVDSITEKVMYICMYICHIYHIYI